MEKVKKTSTAKKAAATGLNGTEPRKTATRKKTGTTEMSVNETAPKKAAAPKMAKSNVTQMQTAPNWTALGVSHEEIARLAHRYWAERGRQHGHDAEDWFRAERELLGKAS
jgi:hypothetical protein